MNVPLDEALRLVDAEFGRVLRHHQGVISRTEPMIDTAATPVVARPSPLAASDLTNLTPSLRDCSHD